MSEQPPAINFDKNPPMQVVQYDNTITKFVPGYNAIFQMSLAYLKARLPAQAELLIVGAGSGKELITFGPAMPGWKLTGVDPSVAMLSVAHAKLVQLQLAEQVTLREGLVQDLPNEPRFEAATLILVMHFLPDDGAKLALLTAIAERLKPGGIFILVDSFGGQPHIDQLNEVWLLHANQMGLAGEALNRIEQATHQLHPITEARNIELLKQAGFENIYRFYTGLYYGGWVMNRKRL